MLVNGNNIVDLTNRPTVLGRNGVRAIFINNGTNTSPYQISGVGIFALSSNASPSSVLGTDNLIASNVTPLMWFANSALETTDSIYDTSNYSPAVNASGIFKLNTGDFVCVLDGSLGLLFNFNGTLYQNTASTVGDYIAVWQIKQVLTGQWQVMINEFHLFNDTFFSLAEPLLLTVRNVLHPREVRFGSKINLKITSEFTIGNKTISNDIKNIFKDSVLINPQFKIMKINENQYNLPAQVTVSSFTNTSSLINVTSDNTMLFNFDTSILPTHSETLAGNMGSLTGLYAVQAKFNVLDQTYYTDLLHFQIT